MTKSQQLLDLMMRNYGRWVSMDDIITTTRMSSFNQRFQEWRKIGILISQTNYNGKSFYMLRTKPAYIDAQRIELRQGVLL